MGTARRRRIWARQRGHDCSDPCLRGPRPRQHRFWNRLLAGETSPSMPRSDTSRKKSSAPRLEPQRRGLRGENAGAPRGGSPQPHPAHKMARAQPAPYCACRSSCCQMAAFAPRRWRDEGGQHRRFDRGLGFIKAPGTDRLRCSIVSTRGPRFTWAGAERISRMAEWPDWNPPAEMIGRQPYLPRFMAGGEGNPLGARALYLGQTLYRIHGTNQPSTIGTFVSSGCIRLTNEDVTDLYSRVQVGTRVVVMPGTPPKTARTNSNAPAVEPTPLALPPGRVQ